MAYAAPETVTSNNLRRSSDQYSLAMVVCAMLRGKELSAQEPFKPFQSLSDRQNAALQRAIAYDPDTRFPSCRNFIQALGWRP